MLRQEYLPANAVPDTAHLLAQPGVLALVSFGDACVAGAQPGIIPLGMPSLCDKPWEVIRYGDSIAERGTDEHCQWSLIEDVLCVATWIAPEDCSDIEAATEVAYGRYWGALARVDCLHFEACYYQPIEWCIQHGLKRFEGGAQGEHKMARALLPTPTHSAHWLAHPAFSEAVARYLEREKAGIDNYMDALQQHSPLKKSQ